MLMLLPFVLIFMIYFFIRSKEPSNLTVLTLMAVPCLTFICIVLSPLGPSVFEGKPSSNSNIASANEYAVVESGDGVVTMTDSGSVAYIDGPNVKTVGIDSVEYGDRNYLRINTYEKDIIKSFITPKKATLVLKKNE